MATIGSSQAQRYLARLIPRVERGETVTITRRGNPVARLVPVATSASRAHLVDVIEAMQRFQETEAPSLGRLLSIRDLINEGRR